MSPLRIGSLFAGIGGFDLAARWMGWSTVWHSEIDPYACAVFAKHFPESRNVGDITTWEPDVERDTVDLICGGFPCQDISYAGLGEGIEGRRSGLWRDYGRVVRILRPRYVLVENVSALLTRGIERVLGDLAEIGYDAEWECVPASAVGAPHRRDRIWILAYPNGGRGTEDSSKSQLRTSGAQQPPSDKRNPNTRTLVEGPQRSGWWNIDPADLADPEAHRLTAEGTPARHDRDTRERYQNLADTNSERGAGLRDELAEPQESGQGWSYSAPNGDGQHGGNGHYAGSSPQSFVGRVADGVPNRVDRLTCLGNAIVPQVAYWIFQQIQAAEESVRAA